MVWAVALGLQEDVERVLQRSSEDLASGRTMHAYQPGWYLPAHAYGGSGGGGGWAGGVALAPLRLLSAEGALEAGLTSCRTARSISPYKP